MCNHPYLLPGTEPEHGSYSQRQQQRIQASGKLQLLDRMLDVLKAGNHRVLLFSQMTRLLDVLEEYVMAKYGADAYERVDGRVGVADRQAAIQRFNKVRSCVLIHIRASSDVALFQCCIARNEAWQAVLRVW